mmetsp:Transcript_9987/g.25427  ORF Transcript_9987/g.25427 Transcript_9987/m.25427 type:complete len:208 (-) Transcript_9987:1899-2522(-)
MSAMRAWDIVFDRLFLLASSTNPENSPSGFFRSCFGVSNSAMRPSSRTMMRSECMMVCRRCAIVSTVQSLNAVRMVAWMSSSVALSMLEVASSSTRMREPSMSARPSPSSCRWPTLRLFPPSEMTESRPRPPSNVLTTSASDTCCSADHMLSSEYWPKGSRLERMVPEKTTGSCGTSARRERRSRSPMSRMSSPSMVKLPRMGSTMR